MAVLVRPQSELIREPRLLVPRLTPVGPVRVDFSNQLTNGLFQLWLFFQNWRGAIIGAAGTYAGNATVANRTLNLDGGGDYVYMTSPVVQAPLSLGVVIKNVTAEGVLVMLGASGATWDGWYLYGYPGAKLAVNSVNNNTFDGVIEFTGAPKENDALAMSATTTALNGALNGVLGLADTSFTDPGTMASPQLRVGVSTRGADNDVAAQIYLVAAWSRALAPDELMSWTADPYQILVPA